MLTKIIGNFHVQNLYPVKIFKLMSTYSKTYSPPLLTGQYMPACATIQSTRCLSSTMEKKRKKKDVKLKAQTHTHKKGNKFKTKNKKKIIIINNIQSSNKTSQAFIDSFDFN